MRLSPLVALLFATAFSTPVLSKTLVTVNGTAITQSELDTVTQQVVNGSGGRIKDTPELRNELKEQLINRTIMLQEAQRRGLDKSNEFKTRLELFRKDLMQQALLDDIAQKKPVKESDVKAEYERIKAQLSGQKEVQARQIILNTEAEANDVIAQAKKGSKFEDLAKQKSKDPAAKQTGGEMGWVNLGAVAPPLAETLKALGKNQVSSTPLQSDIGFHVFKVENIRTAKVPTYNEVKDSLHNQMQGAQIQKSLIELREKAKIQ